MFAYLVAIGNTRLAGIVRCVCEATAPVGTVAA
jgi:hypothetical protein